MPEKHLFEYAVIRVVPRVEREEFINVGVILYCSSRRFLQAEFDINEDRIKALFPLIDLRELYDRLCAFQHVCAGNAAGGPIAKLPIASRFRWLTAARSTIVQTSPVHPGLSEDPGEMLKRLMAEMVGNVEQGM